MNIKTLITITLLALAVACTTWTAERDYRDARGQVLEAWDSAKKAERLLGSQATWKVRLKAEAAMDALLRAEVELKAGETEEAREAAQKAREAARETKEALKAALEAVREVKNTTSSSRGGLQNHNT